ncbi:MAG: NAD(P) transhydrogenase subunit alpha [Rickettsiales bacterium]|nr:NAD(P) transhydrogenase subunit alpha [Rickettsiales bacterium]MCA0254720.1 proton-translocating transhydrogenase family protein [Pseudomonadota bacterium]
MNENIQVIAHEVQQLSSQVAQLTAKLDAISGSSGIIINGVDPLVYVFAVFTLACFVGYYVVWKVTPSLHTPLMSITNAISGIIIIGSLIASSSEHFSFSSVLGFIATFIASINIFGGFIVTQRMLEMFRKK